MPQSQSLASSPCTILGNMRTSDKDDAGQQAHPEGTSAPQYQASAQSQYLQFYMSAGQRSKGPPIRMVDLSHIKSTPPRKGVVREPKWERMTVCTQQPNKDLKALHSNPDGTTIVTICYAQQEKAHMLKPNVYSTMSTTSASDRPEYINWVEHKLKTSTPAKDLHHTQRDAIRSQILHDVDGQIPHHPLHCALT